MATAGSYRLLTGWGRTAPSRARVAGPLATEQLQGLVAARPPGGVLARGAGRSYGDAAQNAGGCVLAPVTRPSVELAAPARSASEPAAPAALAAGPAVRVSASTSFAQLLAAIVPHGLILPVLPGTRDLTVGGAIAADVHGK